MHILVTGGSGYLGQFLVQHLSAQHKVAYTYNSCAKLPEFEGDVKAFKVDLATGAGLQACFAHLAPVEVVINCAAISQPALCERDVELARSINVPSQLLAHLSQQAALHSRTPLLIHISTDQVYDGSKSFWKEGDPCHPVNAYGQSKLAAEQAIQESLSNYVILRSSIIYGPQSPTPVPRSLFLQFIDSALGAGKATTFFSDEFRNPVYVGDICRIVDKVIEASQTSSGAMQRVYNMGGPERLSRVDMALQVAGQRGYNPELVLSVSSASVPRGVKSPEDISMDVGRVQDELHIQLSTFANALHDVFTN